MSKLTYTSQVPSARAPIIATFGSAGYDLSSAFDYVIQPGGRTNVDTGLQIHLPTGCYGRLASRSGLATMGIDVCAGVIDPDYQGRVIVLLHNSGKEPFVIKPGDRIAQLICEKFESPDISPFSRAPASEGTAVPPPEPIHRGQCGFGSTGLNLDQGRTAAIPPAQNAPAQNAPVQNAPVMFQGFGSWIHPLVAQPLVAQPVNNQKVGLNGQPLGSSGLFSRPATDNQGPTATGGQGPTASSQGTATGGSDNGNLF